MLKCIYCKVEEFEKGKGSEEHVILSSLGGRKASKNICCVACNNKYGDEIDSDLAIELSFFGTMLDIITGRNQQAPTIKKALVHDGREYDISSGGNFKLSKIAVDVETIDEKTKSISITASDKAQALRALEGILKGMGRSLDDFENLTAQSIKTYPESIHKRIAIGGEVQFRSAAKMMLTFAATLVSPERLRSACFASFIEYIKGGEKAYGGVLHDTETIFPEKPSLDEVNHRVFFLAFHDLKCAVGLIELYGSLRFSAVMTNEWDGPNLFKCYAVDPVTKKQVTTNINCDQSLVESVNNKDYDMQKVNLSVGKIIEVFQRRQSEKITSEIAQIAIDRNLVIGEYITEEQISQMAHEVALNFVKHIKRIDDIEDIDLRD